jgi:hypothetical protein
MTKIVIPGTPADGAEVARLRAALADIARQKRPSEFDTSEEAMNADYEGGYDECVKRARAALSTPTDAKE